jgi:DNA polymerase
VEAFDRGEDVYKIMASAIYGKSVDDITKDERFVGKTTILGCGYGMGAAKFQAQLKNFNVEITLDEAKRIIDTYRTTYPKITALWKDAGTALDAILRGSAMGLGRDKVLKIEGKDGILLPNGLWLRYPNLRKRTEEGKTELVYDTKKGKATIPNRIYGGKVIENVCQALARIVIGEQMLLIAKKYKVVMTVHDAIACIVPKDEAKPAQEYVEMCMRIRPKWASELPLNCESGFGYSYGQC